MLSIENFTTFLTTKQGMSGWTVTCHKGRFKRFMAWVNERELTPALVDQYMASIQHYEDSTINSYIAFFRILEKFVKYPLLIDYKSRRVEKPVIHELTPQEFEKLLNTTIPCKRCKHPKYCKEKTYVAFTMFLCLTGCRYEEAQHLTCEHVDLSAKHVTFVKTKGKKARRLHIESPILEVMQAMVKGKSPQDRVFTNREGGPIYESNFSQNIHERAERAGFAKRVYPHLLRHSFATQLHVSKVGIEIIQRLLGHKNIQTTLGYVELYDDEAYEAQKKLPMIQKYCPPSEVIDTMRESIQSSGHDERFNYFFTQSGDCLQFRMELKHM